MQLVKFQLTKNIRYRVSNQTYNFTPVPLAISTNPLVFLTHDCETFRFARDKKHHVIFFVRPRPNGRNDIFMAEVTVKAWTRRYFAKGLLLFEWLGTLYYVVRL